MDGFSRDAQQRALLGGTPLLDLLDGVGGQTPAYFYDLDGIEATVRGLVAALGDPRHTVAYAVKANTAGSLLRRVAAAGGGADVVSGGELAVAEATGIAPSKIVMSGVAKLDAELDLALSRRLLGIQAESVEELERIGQRARALGVTARVALRVNPSVDIDSHAHIATGHDEAKFGIAREALPEAWRRIDASEGWLEGVGLSMHVGSMLREPGPYLEAARVVCEEARARLRAGGRLDYLSFGGGFGIDYGEGACEPPVAFARAALDLLRAEGLGALRLVLEPGRAIVAPFGVLVARVVQTKEHQGKRWLMLDAGMNDLLRPALYQAHHRVEALDAAPSGHPWRVVGPVCESADDFGLHPMGSEAPALVVLRDAGAYGYTMASEYNGRALPTEAFVSGGRVVHVSATRGVEDWVRRRLEA